MHKRVKAVKYSLSDLEALAPVHTVFLQSPLKLGSANGQHAREAFLHRQVVSDLGLQAGTATALALTHTSHHKIIAWLMATF